MRHKIKTLVNKNIYIYHNNTTTSPHSTMSNAFLYKPVGVHLVDLKTNKFTHTYVFVGGVSDNIMKHLEMLAKNPDRSDDVLSKFYGPGYHKLLFAQRAGKTGGVDAAELNQPSDVAGLDDQMAGLDMEDLEMAGLDMENEMSGEMMDDMLGDLSGILNEDPEAVPVEAVKIKMASGAHTSYINEYFVYPVDNILEFKYKIFMTCGIPIYRQHLWYKSKSRVFPCSYDMMLHGNNILVNIEKLINIYQGKIKVDFIEGVPVEPKYWNAKADISIVARDTFTLLGNIHERYGTVEYYLADLADIIPKETAQKIAADKYQMELVYYGFVQLYFPMCTVAVFADYIKNEKELEHTYPELVPRKQALYQQFKLESLITETAYAVNSQKTELHQIMDRLASAITHTTVSIEQHIYDSELLVALRNLFDCLELNELMCYCRASLLYDNKHVILRKSFQNEKEAKDIIPLNSLLIKIKTSTDTNENMRLIIYKSGNYIIKTEWREENQMTFKKIIATVCARVNPIIRAINALGSKVKYFNADLMEVTQSNVQFTETSISYYYDDDITDVKFNLLKDILYDMQVGGIINNKEATASRPPGTYEYFFSKGMYFYDVTRISKLINIANYYDFLSNGVIKQKWETLFIRTRLFNVSNVASKLKVMISGIRDDTEMNNFYMYLVALVNIYRSNVKKLKNTVQAPQKSKKALKNLKLQDPLLYDFKKIYGSDVVYSKICQKPYQPVILTNEEYDKLTSAQKDRAIKYWNFTKEKPVFYSCPNPKYPYIKFITGEHPKKFCIPCCKKIEMSEKVNVIKQEIHNTCLTEHCYMQDKVAITKSNNYIASYGKPIDAGRICRLPEHTLEPLFFDTYSPTGVIDQECSTTDGFYLFGIVQSLPLVENVGVLFCIVHALGLSMDEFLIDCAERIRKTPDKFNILLDGEAPLYFSAASEMAAVIASLNSATLIKAQYLKVPWNKLFQNLAYYYYGINCIMFIDKKKEAIELCLPRGLTIYSEMFPVNMKNLVILQQGPRYYPTYLFNTEIFKRTGLIDTKLFLHESGLITIIKAVVRKTLEKSADMINYINLTSVLQFVKDSGARVLALYINSVNMCYAVAIELDGVKFYFPVFTSYYTIGHKLIYKPYNNEYNPSLPDMMRIIEKFNKYVYKISKAAGLEGVTQIPLIVVRQWLRYNKKIIGFLSNDLYWYIRDTNESEAVKAVAVDIQPLYYNPVKINALIYDAKQSKELKTSTLDISHSLYKHYIYQLVLLQYISFFNSHRNKPLRTAIIKAISDITLDDQQALTALIVKMDADDAAKFKKILSKYLVDHHQKNILLDQIHAVTFNFDRVLLEKFRTMKQNEIYEELNKIAKTFVQISDLPKMEFPNILAPCEKGSRGYCNGDKLYITKQKLHEITNIIAANMTNPYNWKRLFNSVFISKTVDYFKFIKRKHETITIELNE
jgi:hypothetical protein